jgi:SAM-dependent methyltransferase
MAAQAAAALGIPIPATLDEVASGEFDAITLWEVVEHLPRPLGELRRLAERLRPGGVLMLSTPNTDHWQAQREPAQWEGYRPPSHVVHFTAATLRLALEGAGLEVIAITPTAPLPQVPGLWRRATVPLQQALAWGTARPWRLALLVWRAVRVVSWAWQRLVRPADDVYATLEALAVRRS